MPGFARTVAGNTRVVRSSLCSTGPSTASVSNTITPVPVASNRYPAPSASPIAATTQIVAALVRPITVPPSFMIVPAPRKPMPAITCAAIIDGCGPTPFAPTVPIRTDRSPSSAAPTQIRMLVRSPAGFPASCRSMPIAPPSTTASSSDSVRSRRSTSTMSPIAFGITTDCSASIMRSVPVAIAT